MKRTGLFGGSIHILDPRQCKLLLTGPVLLFFLIILYALPLFAGGSLTDLGVLTGGAASEAAGVSADGSVVVGWSTDGSGNPRAFYWTQAGGMVDLAGSGAIYSKAFGVSSDGNTVVGTWTDSSKQQWRAFLWTKTTGMRDLDILSGTSSSSAYGASGPAVVGSPAAWRWTEAGGMTDLKSDNAYAVSADGTVVAGGVLHGWRWTEAGGTVSLGSLPGKTYSAAYAISADGSSVVGESGTAFRWTEAGGTVSLGTLTGGTTSTALGASTDGSVVVGTATDSTSARQAFRWTAAGMQTVKDWLTAHGVTVANTLASAVATSSDGYAIAGQNSNNHAYLAKVNTKGTLTLSRTGTGTGTITSSPEGITCGSTCSYAYAEGTKVTLTAEADADCAFQEWTGCASVSGTTCTVTMTSDATVTARFGHNATLKVTKTGNGAGSITSSPAGISCGDTCSYIYGPGAAVILTATAGSGSRFQSWSGCPSPNGSFCTAVMSADTAVTAQFALVKTLTCHEVRSGKRRKNPRQHRHRLRGPLPPGERCLPSGTGSDPQREFAAPIRFPVLDG